MSNYWQRWIGDWKRKTAHLSACQKGVYGELLDHLYASDCAELPSSEDMIFRIAGAVDDAEREAVRAVLAQFFSKTERGFVNGRVAEEIAKRGAYVALRRAGAQKRWAAKPQPAITTAAQHSNGAPEMFELFWQAYPKKVAKPAALRAFKAARIGNGDMEHILAALDQQLSQEQWTRDAGKFIPYPATWLNQKRWQDLPPAPRQKGRPFVV